MSSTSAFAPPEPTVDFAALDIRNDIQSPLVMKGLFQGRSAGGRAAGLKNYAGQWGQYTEMSVIKALEWLKKKQNPDGSWNPNKTAMTGLALLTFLAHGETTSSEKYGADGREGHPVPDLPAGRRGALLQDGRPARARTRTASRPMRSARRTG